MWTWLLRVPYTEVVNRERSHTLMAGGFDFAFDFPSSLCGVAQKFLKLTGKWCLCLSNLPTSCTTWHGLLVHKQKLQKDHRPQNQPRVQTSVKVDLSEFASWRAVDSSFSGPLPRLYLSEASSVGMTLTVTQGDVSLSVRALTSFLLSPQGFPFTFTSWSVIYTDMEFSVQKPAFKINLIAVSSSQIFVNLFPFSEPWRFLSIKGKEQHRPGSWCV